MNKEDLAFWKFIFDITQLVITLGIAIYVWILSKHKVNATKIAQLEEAHAAKISALEDKHRNELSTVKTELATIQANIKHMPDKRSIHNIHERLNGQSELLRKMEGEMKGTADNTAMILETLIKKGDK
ncbi:MAG: hypothetical protein CR977_00850 [Gammaproteobacteria bacterium]|nr:MAG: hypothetical protein CR977_00850 [Gammaproteobacteria bacterium]